MKMRPIKLKIKGLNSFIEEQTIDFEKLTDCGLFGIILYASFSFAQPAINPATKLNNTIDFKINGIIFSLI